MLAVIEPYRRRESEMDWRMQAACRHADPDLFFPEGTTGPALQAIAAAKQICFACPVRARCLDWALDHPAAFGIWGGRTEEERRAFRGVPAQRRPEPAQRRPEPASHDSPVL
jgi:WhiB family transcriptional regulator, redox-sensing transcriptional regulator